MASRFQLLWRGFKKLSETAENQNAEESTSNWVTIYIQWAHERSINPNLEETDAESLDKVLSVLLRNS